MVISLDIKQKMQRNPISWATAAYKCVWYLVMFLPEYNFDIKAKELCER